MNLTTIVLALASGFLTACTSSQERGDSDMDDLKALVLSKNPEAAARAKHLGPKAAPLLAELSRNPDAGVRRTALNSFREIGGSEAVKAFLRGLRDEDPQVAGSAAGGFERFFEPTHAGELMEAYSQAPDPLARQEIGLFLGRSDRVDLKELRKLRDSEREPEAREGVVAGLARLGDKESQEEFLRGLIASKERERLRRLEHAASIGQPWLLKPLLPLLDDRNGLVSRGVDARPNEILTLRTCDLAVNLVAKISGWKFSFPVGDRRNYQDSEVDEVRRFLKGLP